jgi:hypothetical protein
VDVTQTSRSLRLHDELDEDQMTTALSYLFKPESPWIYIGLGEFERMKWNPSHFYSQPEINVCVRSLRGKKMRTTQALMNEFAAALQFFDGFGENWYALRDCLEYMDEWLPADAYVLIIENAQELLHEEQPSAMSALLKTLHETGEWWAKPIADNGRFNRKEIPFHVLLNVSDNEPSAAEKIIAIAQETNIPVRS